MTTLEALKPEVEAQVVQQDDGMRLKCTACNAYLMPDPEGPAMKCDRCDEWFTLCDECMPDTDVARDAVWLCPECR